MIAGIYCIENLLNGKKYIGQSANIKSRMFWKHYECPVLYKAIKKYRKENFKKYVLIYCEVKELERYEIACIKIFHSHISEHGYNISWGGDAPMRGRKQSKKSRQKISEAMSGEKNPFFGKQHSYESIQKQSEIKSGEKNPMFGKHHFGKKAPFFGKRHTEETKKKMAKARLIYWKKKRGE
jgi:group I intron endonuclease